MSAYAEWVLFMGAAEAFRVSIRQKLKDERETWWGALELLVDTVFSLGCLTYAGVIAFRIGAGWAS